MTTRHDQHNVGNPSMTLVAAGHLSGWCARHPYAIVVAWSLALVLSLLSLSRLTVSGSLSAMLGEGARAAAATQRIVSGSQGGDDLFVVAELTGETPSPPAGPASELVEFGQRLIDSLAADPAARGLVATVRSGGEEDITRYVRDVVTPRAAFFLSEAQLDAALRKLEPHAIRDQITRNEALMAASGPAAGALSKQILRDPLRLFEIISQGQAPPSTVPSMLADPSAASASASLAELSSDGRAILLRVSSTMPSDNLEVARRLSEMVAKHVALANTGHLRVQIGGPAPIAATAARVIRADAIWATIVSVGLLTLLFGVFYGRWSAVLLVGGVASVGMTVGVGIFSVFLGDVSPLGAMIAALLAGLGTDYGIHFMSHYDGARAEGLGCAEAASRTSRHMAIPITTNCMTSIIGFVSLWPSQIKMLSDFASLGAAGLLGALLAVFVLLPAVLALVDARPAGHSSGIAQFGKIAEGVARWPRICIAICGAALVLAVLAAGGRGFSLQIEPDLSVMHPRPNPALDATRFVMERFVSRGEVVPIEVEGHTFEDLLENAHDAAGAIIGSKPSIPGLVLVAGIHQLVPDARLNAGRLQRLAGVDSAAALKAFDESIEASVFDANAYSGYRRYLVSLLESREPPTLADVFADPVLAGRLFLHFEHHAPAGTPKRTILLATFQTPLADRLLRGATVGALNAALKGHAGVTVAGFAAVSEELDAAVRADLPRSVAISVGLVLVWLLIVFRRPIDVALALLPLLFAGGSIVLFMMATGQTFNPINSIAIPLLDGIAVDAGVFLVAAARTHGQTRAGLVRHLRLTTHAIVLAVGTTLTAFMALCMSHTPAIASLGLVASVGITAAFGAVLLLLLPILILRTPVGNGRDASEPPNQGGGCLPPTTVSSIAERSCA